MLSSTGAWRRPNESVKLQLHRSCRAVRHPTDDRMISLPAAIKDEDAALDWWDTEFAGRCEELDVHVSASALVRAIVSSLRQLRSDAVENSVSLSEAARRSGYSSEHLGRLIRAGKVFNAGRKGSPRIRLRDIPVRPQSKLAPVTREPYDPATDARFLRVRR
jgi:hypothetical protein